MNKSNENNFYDKVQANPWALLPMGVFVVLFITSAICINTIDGLSDIFTSTPIVPSFLIALIVAVIQSAIKVQRRTFRIIGKGIGNSSIISMILIFLLAGIFAGTVGYSSATSIAYLLLNVFPVELYVLIIFIVSCLVSLAMGTSVGSVTLMVPIAVSVSSASGQSLGLCVACAICGSMFGDNLSVISDTAIAACSGMKCNPKEKFYANLRMALPAAFISIVIIFLLSFNGGNGQKITEPYDILQFLPYIIVLILSICGVNVFIVLTIGIITGAIIMLATLQVNFLNLCFNMYDGIQGMYELIVVTLLVAAISALIAANGGIKFILDILKKYCKSSNIAQLGLGILVGLTDFITANNTVAIVVTVPVAREVCDYYNISKRRVASIIDTFSCIVQGLLPYGAQIVISLNLVKSLGQSLSAFDIITNCIYQYVLLIVVVFQILTGLADTKKIRQKIKAKRSQKNTNI